MRCNFAAIELVGLKQLAPGARHAQGGGDGALADIELRSLDLFYRILFADGDPFNPSGDPDKQRAEVRRISPSDAAGYERFMAEADHCDKLGFKAPGTKAFDTVSDLIKASPAIFFACAVDAACTRLVDDCHPSACELAANEAAARATVNGRVAWTLDLFERLEVQKPAQRDNATA